MSHSRRVCEHGVVISQCRCAGPRTIVVVRPCPFGDQHLGMVVVHPLPPVTAVGQGLGQVPQEPPQAPEGEPITPAPVSLDAPEASGGAEGVELGFFQRVVARKLARRVPEWAGLCDDEPRRLAAALAPEVGRILADQLLELAEMLTEPTELRSPAELLVDTASLIDATHTELRWDAEGQVRR